jgi:hypothetical protein
MTHRVIIQPRAEHGRFGSRWRRFQKKGGKSREIPVRHDLQGVILADVEAAGICFGRAMAAQRS